MRVKYFTQTFVRRVDNFEDFCSALKVIGGNEALPITLHNIYYGLNGERPS